MRARGVNEVYVHAVQMLYEHMTASVKIRWQIIALLRITTGLRQRCNIASTLFKIYLNGDLEQWRRQCYSMGIPIKRDCLCTLPTIKWFWPKMILTLTTCYKKTKKCIQWIWSKYEYMQNRINENWRTTTGFGFRKLRK